MAIPTEIQNIKENFCNQLLKLKDALRQSPAQQKSITGFLMKALWTKQANDTPQKVNNEIAIILNKAFQLIFRYQGENCAFFYVHLQNLNDEIKKIPSYSKEKKVMSDLCHFAANEIKRQHIRPDVIEDARRQIQAQLVISRLNNN